MAITKAAGYPTIQLKYPFEKMSRKLTLRKNTCSGSKATKIQNVYGGVLYTDRANKLGLGGRQYFFMRENPRTTPVTAMETYYRTRFRSVRAMVKTRSEDLATLDQDQAAFLAQKNQPGGVKSFNAYLWKICCEQYDAQHPLS